MYRGLDRELLEHSIDVINICVWGTCVFRLAYCSNSSQWISLILTPHYQSNTLVSTFFYHSANDTIRQCRKRHHVTLITFQNLCVYKPFNSFISFYCLYDDHFTAYMISAPWLFVHILDDYIHCISPLPYQGFVYCWKLFSRPPSFILLLSLHT